MAFGDLQASPLCSSPRSVRQSIGGLPESDKYNLLDNAFSASLEQKRGTEVELKNLQFGGV